MAAWRLMTGSRAAMHIKQKHIKQKHIKQKHIKQDQ